MKILQFFGILLLGLSSYSYTQAQNFWAKDFFEKGEIELHVGDFKEAVKNYDRALAYYPNYTQAYFSRGRAYQHLKQFSFALSDFLKVIELQPSHAEAYFYAGTLYYQNKEYEKAISFYNQAIEKDSMRAIYWNYRAESHQELGLLSLALADYEQAIRYTNDEAILFFGRGKCYLNNTQYKEAIQDFSRAIKLEPRKFEYLQYRAETYFVAGEYALAAQDLDAMITQKRGKLDAHYYSLNVYCKAKSEDYTGAVFAMDELIKTQNPNADLYLERAGFHLLLKNYALALFDYQNVIRLDSNNYEVLKKCCELSWLSRKYSAAIQFANKALQYFPNEASIWYWRGMSHAELGQKKEATDDIVKAVRLGYPKQNIPPAYQKAIKRIQKSDKNSSK
jgi:tetratricopeptide (TPR) repeat protein